MTENFDVPNRFPGQQYVLIRVTGQEGDDVTVDFEQGGFGTVTTALEFLRAVVETSEEA